MSDDIQIEGIDNSSDYTNIRRRKEIFNWRRDHKQYRKAVNEAFIQGEIDEERAARLIHADLMEFLSDIHHLMTHTYDDVGMSEVWESRGIGDPFQLGATNQVHQVQGLGELVGPGYVQTTVTEEESTSTGGTTETTQTIKVTYPRQVLFDAFDQATEFLAKAGLELDRSGDPLRPDEPGI